MGKIPIFQQSLILVGSLVSLTIKIPKTHIVRKSKIEDPHQKLLFLSRHEHFKKGCL